LLTYPLLRTTLRTRSAHAPHTALTATLTPSITHLEFWNSGITAEGVAVLAAAVQASATLEHVALDYNEQQQREEGEGLAQQQQALLGSLAALVAATQDTKVAFLSLRGNGVDDACAASLATALEGNTALVGLQLFDNRIGCAGAAALSVALRHNATLKGLSVARNAIGPAGGRALAEAVTRYPVSAAEVEEMKAAAEEAGGGGKGKKGKKGAPAEAEGPTLIELPDGSFASTGNTTLATLDLAHNPRLGGEAGGGGAVVDIFTDHLRRSWEAKYPPPVAAEGEGGEGGGAGGGDEGKGGGGEEDAEPKEPMPMPLNVFGIHGCGMGAESEEAIKKVLAGTLFMPPPPPPAEEDGGGGDAEGRGGGDEEKSSGKKK
jgi:hypothetical protein